jgi:hypothetical protein
MACKNYNVVINQLDLNNAINNSDPDLDGKVFISFTDCNGEPISIGYSTAGTYLNAFCADDDEVITAVYWFDDLGALSFRSTATPISDCVAPTPTPSLTPSFSVTPTPSTTPLYPCNCINFTNTTSSLAYVSYTRCDNTASELVTLQPNESLTICGSNPGVVSGPVTITVLGTCVGKQCIPFTPTPTPSLSITPTISLTPSTTPSNTPSISITPSNTPSISITPSITPSNTIAPSMTPSPTISVSKTPSLTPLPSVSKTPSISITPSITPSTGVSPTPTPTTSTTGSIITVDGLCMTIKFGAAPSPTPSITPTITPSTTPSATPSTTPSITPSISISVTPSITPSITPSTTPSSTNPPPPPSATPSNTPSTSISTTPSRTPSKTPSVTPSITVSVTPSITPPSECPVYYLNYNVTNNTGSYKSYYYSLLTNNSTLVTTSPYPSEGIPITDLTFSDNKFWYLSNSSTGVPSNPSTYAVQAKIIEFNIVNSLNMSYNRTLNINLPSGSASAGVSGLCVLNSTTLLSTRSVGTSVSNPIIIALNIANNGTSTDVFTPIQGRYISGMLYTTTGKLITISQAPGSQLYITQYSYPSGVVEFDLPVQYGNGSIFENNGGIYFTVSNNLYKISNTAPYLITSINNIGRNVQNSSGKNNCNTVNFVPNVAPPATPTPTPTISVTPSPSVPSVVCPLIYTVNRPQTYTGSPGGTQTSGFYTKNYTWNPTTNVQQEIVLANDIIGNDIASTGTRLWKSFSVFVPTGNPQFANYINEWNLSGNPPYTTTFTRTLNYPAGYNTSPGLTAKNNNTLVDVTSTIVNGQTVWKVYEINIPAFPATQLTSTFKFDLNSNFRGQGDLMLTSDANGNPSKLLLACNVSNPTPGTTNNIIAIQQYDYNTGAFEFETTLTSPTAPPANLIAGISQFNNTIYVLFASNPNSPPNTGWVYSINSNPPYNWTLVNNTLDAGGANSILSCSQGKLIGPNTNGCDDIIYKTQTNQYYSYNFSTNISTLLNVPTTTYDSTAVSLGISIAPLARTSNKLWSYTWRPAGPNNLNSYNLVEYNTTSNPFAATINRYIALPQILGTNFTPGTGLFAISDTKLIGTVTRLGGLALNSAIEEPQYNDPAQPLRRYANGVMVVEYDISSNVATWNLKAKLFPNEIPTGDLLLTLDNKLIVLTRTLTNTQYFISQFNYNTGVLEFRSQISPTITTDCGLAEVNGEIYIMGFNVYKFNRTTYTLELTQSPQTQLVASSQLANCINVNLPTSSCPECKGLPLKLLTPVTYGGVTISPTYTGALYQSPTFVGARDDQYPGTFVQCTGSNVITHPSYSAWLGAGTAQSPYTYSLNFSEPVNDIKIMYNGTNGYANNPYELFTWGTNVGTPNISLCQGCYQTINGNIISGSNDPSSVTIAGGGVITISAPVNYTTLTLRSPGGNQGTIFSICSGSVIPKPANALGCVYSSDGTYTYLYNVANNTSSSVTIPIDQQPVPNLSSECDTHTLTKYWKGNRWNTIKEWNTTSTPNVLSLNRTIAVQGFPFPFGSDQKQFGKMQAINDTTLLVNVSQVVNNPSTIFFGNWVNTIALFNITTNIVGSAQQTSLFNVYAPAGGADAFLLTTNNKLIIVGRRGTGVDTSNYYNYYLSQYSYPDGALELDISLATYLPSPTGSGIAYLVSLFESNNGKLYLKAGASSPLSPFLSRMYEINLNSPYILTQVWNDTTWRFQNFNSSINCNTVALNPAQPPAPSSSPSPTPTPSLTPPVSPNVGVNTIYKYLDIL